MIEFQMEHERKIYFLELDLKKMMEVGVRRDPDNLHEYLKVIKIENKGISQELKK